MKFKDFTTKNIQTLEKDAVLLLEQIRDVRVAVRVGSEKNSSKLKVLKRDLARTLTRISQIDLEV
jgi:ribosomal protein L29